jgi:RimJ/RimL family protein N-acetyltransferase
MAKLPPPNLALETKRFIMRPLNGSDASEELASWTEHASTAEMLNTRQRSWSVAEQRAYFASFESQPDKRLLGIWRRDQDPPIGLYLLQLQPAPGTFLISHIIGNMAWRGKAVAEETAEAIYEYFFDRLGYAKAKANIMPQNRAVLWLLLREGVWRKEAHLVGHLRDAATGQRDDVLVLGMLAEDWRATRKG